MKLVLQFLVPFAEYYLLIVVLLAGYTPPLGLSALSIGLVFLLALQIYSNYDISGIAIAMCFAFVNFYMVLAIVSEFLEYPEWNAEALLLLFTGLSLVLLNLLACGLIWYKYMTKGNYRPSQKRDR